MTIMIINSPLIQASIDRSKNTIHYHIQKKNLQINTMVYEKNNKLIIKRVIEFKSKSYEKRCTDIVSFDSIKIENQELECVTCLD
jgi:hypothetical protein